MKRISVDIGGTFTDCFVAWEDRYIQAKALTTHHNLAQGFNEALDHACTTLNLRRNDVLREVDSVRYATTLGTNALIERRGPQVGVIVTAGFEATIPLSRGRGYGEGLDELAKNDMSSGTRPDPLVPQTLIRSVRERVDYYEAFWREALTRAQGLRRVGSAALDLCWVACGRVDAYWEWRLGPWDVAAGALIVREAGGVVSDFGGAPHDLFGSETLASNGSLHGAMLALLAPHR